MKKLLISLIVLSAMLLSISAKVASAADPVELIMGSWRTEDGKQWEQIAAAFQKTHPNIKITFRPTTNVEFVSALRASLEGGTGPDLMHCLGFDLSLGLFEKGYLSEVTNLPGIEHFSDVARSGWTTDDGKHVYCVPMGSVIHGVYYNADMFDKNGWKVPKTMDEFMALLKTVKDAGVTPLSLGTKNGAFVSDLIFGSFGPNYWDGENGRKALVAGTAKLTDPQFVAAYSMVNSMAPYLPDGFSAIDYPSTQQLFTLGRAAMMPSGSWEIPLFEANAKFKIGVFKPPLPKADQQTCWITDHIDSGMGMNAATKHPEEAKAFLEWTTTQDFAELYSNLLPGFFSLSDYKMTLKDPLAQQFVSWRQECKSTIRIFFQFLSRGERAADAESWRVIPAMLAGDYTPAQAAAEEQKFLWYPKK